MTATAAGLTSTRSAGEVAQRAGAMDTEAVLLERDAQPAALASYRRAPVREQRGESADQFRALSGAWPLL
jgi:hypothetical protein